MPETEYNTIKQQFMTYLQATPPPDDFDKQELFNTPQSEGVKLYFTNGAQIRLGKDNMSNDYFIIFTPNAIKIIKDNNLDDLTKYKKIRT
jgi:hypothetical protein